MFLFVSFSSAVLLTDCSCLSFLGVGATLYRVRSVVESWSFSASELQNPDSLYCGFDVGRRPPLEDRYFAHPWSSVGLLMSELCVLFSLIIESVIWLCRNRRQCFIVNCMPDTQYVIWTGVVSFVQLFENVFLFASCMSDCVNACLCVWSLRAYTYEFAFNDKSFCCVYTLCSEKNTHSQFLSHHRVWWVDLNENYSEYA